MRKINDKPALKNLKDRTLRIFKMEDEIENEETSLASPLKIEKSIDNIKHLNGKRNIKKGKKSGASFNSTFPSEIDFNHPYRQALMAIKTKPFILMAGMCGTGKSRFARTLAFQTCPKYLQENGQPGNFGIIAVRPEWSDSSDAIGWFNRGIYHFTTFIFFLIKAWRHIDTPFVLCLDEMNLAKVEHYFADFLSILESRQWINNEFVSDPFIKPDQLKFYADQDPNMWARIGLKLDIELKNRFLAHGITLPPNLIVIGTANMDYSGHRFSMKVLDRITVIEMTEIDFYGGIKTDDTDLKFPDTPLSKDKVLGRILCGKEAYNLSPKHGDLVIAELQAIDRILSGVPFRFGYRVRDAALIYYVYNSQLAGIPHNNDSVYKCLDEIILMKILPRIDANGAEKIIDSFVRFTKGKYPRSFQRLLHMQSEADKYCGISFWQ
ncbi:McrB family protein [Chitinophaga sp. CF418]|uniref:McrB family protein n=1 Tax=Chitinophaga sp. CF418 TaxID=1855287 RepID=UPI00090FAC32|nr:hypothetical protein [Chitinophaga sp. CF418]SHN30751.1 hypothetical protein SAMN05216311_108345 [Chitinophaga sp. CF418]